MPVFFLHEDHSCRTYFFLSEYLLHKNAVREIHVHCLRGFIIAYHSTYTDAVGVAAADVILVKSKRVTVP